MKCPFCLGDQRKSKEHLLSKPICNAVGMDRGMTVASLDRNTGDVGPLVPLDGRSVRLPCEDCNSGWMSKLETNAGKTLRRWISDPKRPLANSGYTHLLRWLVKTAIVFGFSEGGSRRMIDTPADVIVPDITTARAVREGHVPDHVRAGAARVDTSTFVWGTGNATVLPAGPDRLSPRAVNVTALNLGPVQLWVVLPLVRPDDLRLPGGVAQLSPRLRFGSLRTRTGDLDPSAVTVTYSDAVTRAVFRAIEATAQDSHDKW